MGSAYTAVADDSSAHYYNPAGLARQRDIRFDLGYAYHDPRLRFDGGDADVDLVKGLQLGVVLPGELLERRFGVGLSMMLLDDRVTRVRALPQQQPRFVLFDNRPQRLYITANFAFEPVDHLFIGGGVTFMANTSGRLNVAGVVSLDVPEETVLQGSVDVDIESARYAQAGILYAPDAPWSLGLTFRQEYFLDLQLGTFVSGDITSDALGGDPLVLVEGASFLFDSFNANLFSPMQLVLGASYDFGRVLLSADVGWYRWSRFRAPASDVLIELDLGDLAFDIPPIDPIENPAFSDVVVPRIGVEGSVIEADHFALQVRGGYFFEDSPAPDQPGLTNYADSAKHGLSFGLGLDFIDFSSVLPKPLELDLALLYVRMVEREYLKDDPADLVGDYSIDGHIFGASMMLGIRL